MPHLRVYLYRQEGHKVPSTSTNARHCAGHQEVFRARSAHVLQRAGWEAFSALQAVALLNSASGAKAATGIAT